MRPSALAYLYGRRLRTHPVQEILAGLGISLGVALVLSVLIANQSITGSSEQILRGISGEATLQLSTRDPTGMDQSVVKRVSELPGVAQAASVLIEPASVSLGDKRVSVDVVSADAGLTVLSSAAARVPVGLAGVMLPSATAKALGVSQPRAGAIAPKLPSVFVEIGGRRVQVPVGAVLGGETIGALSSALAVLAPLETGQLLVGRPGRVTAVLVRPRPGQREAVARGLRGIAGDRLTVGSPSDDVALLRTATRPSICAISALLDSLIDYRGDVETGNHSFVSHYGSSSEMAERFAWIVAEADRRLGLLGAPRRHRVLLAGLGSFYLSDPEATSVFARETRARTILAAGSITRPMVAVMTFRRARHKRGFSSG